MPVPAPRTGADAEAGASDNAPAPEGGGATSDVYATAAGDGSGKATDAAVDGQAELVKLAGRVAVIWFVFSKVYK